MSGKKNQIFVLSLVDHLSIFPTLVVQQSFCEQKIIDIQISTSVWWPVWHSEHLALINLASLCGENVSLSLSYFGGLIRFDSLLGEPSSTLILYILLVVFHLCSRDDDSPILCCLKNHLPFRQSQTLLSSRHASAC